VIKPLSLSENVQNLAMLFTNVMTRKSSILTIIASITISLSIAVFIGQGGSDTHGIPSSVICCLVAFVFQWAAFLPAYHFQTERYYDLVGSASYLCLIALALSLSKSIDVRDTVIALLVSIWALRLGIFLFYRIKKQGHDSRFDDIKPDFWWFLMVWTLQGLWVFITLTMALAAITTNVKQEFGLLGLLGIAVWIFGFSFEVIADFQKSRFRNNDKNTGSFITTGLWSWSRHPNYFGEIVLWIGISLIAAPAISGWQWVALISPLFVAFLVTRISGVTLLETKALERWGKDPAYRNYVSRTSCIIPKPPRCE
jgi:steroid 5-alpha reductase family enzyme